MKKKRTRSFRFTVFLSSFWFKVLNDKQNVYVTMNDLFDKPWKKNPNVSGVFFLHFYGHYYENGTCRRNEAKVETAVKVIAVIMLTIKP